ncbi:kinase-like domain-containing protein, partial [Russula brevipes]
WMENGNLREYIRGHMDADHIRLLSQVASGAHTACFFTKKGSFHGDLCDRNILINGDGRAFVSGFGLSEFQMYVCLSGAVPSAFDLSRARWLAPERVTIAGATCSTLETDIWTFGLLCLEVFMGEKPYNSYSDLYVPILLSKGTTPEHPGSTAVGLSPRMWELMQSCWMIDPAVRPSMSTICDMLPPRVGE